MLLSREEHYLVSIQERVHEPGARVLWWGREEGRVSLPALRRLLAPPLSSALFHPGQAPHVGPFAVLSEPHARVTGYVSSLHGGDLCLGRVSTTQSRHTQLDSSRLTFLDLLFLDLLGAHLIGLRLLVGPQLLHVLLLLPLSLIQVTLQGRAASKGSAQPR